MWSYAIAVVAALVCWKIGQGPPVNSTTEQQQKHRNLPLVVGILIIVGLFFCGKSGLAAIAGLVIGAILVFGASLFRRR